MRRALCEIIGGFHPMPLLVNQDGTSNASMVEETK